MKAGGRHKPLKETPCLFLQGYITTSFTSLSLVLQLELEPALVVLVHWTFALQLTLDSGQVLLSEQVQSLKVC